MRQRSLHARQSAWDVSTSAIFRPKTVANPAQGAASLGLCCAVSTRGEYVGGACLIQCKSTPISAGCATRTFLAKNIKTAKCFIDFSFPFSLSTYPPGRDYDLTSSLFVRFPCEPAESCLEKGVLRRQTEQVQHALRTGLLRHRSRASGTLKCFGAMSGVVQK